MSYYNPYRRYRRRSKASLRREIERIFPGLLEKQKMPEWANDEELEQLINLCKIHLGIKDDDVQQGYSKDP